MLLPYITLGLLVVGLFAIRSRKVIAALLAAQILFAFVSEIINPMGLLSIALFWGICTLHWRHLSSIKLLNALTLYFIIAIAIGFASHMIPGFHNLRIFSGLVISPSGAPFTMYLNFDKTIAAVILAATSTLFLRQIGHFTMKSLVESFLIA